MPYVIAPVVSKIAVFIFLLIAQIELHAQVQVVVNVVPPYSTLAKDYLQQGSNVMITVINGSSTPQSVRLVASLKGMNNNLLLAVRDNYIPTAPITINPGQSRLFTLDQLRVFNNNITGDDLVLQGFDKNDYQGGGRLPEGLYQLCVKVFLYNDPAGNTPLNEGCATMNLVAFEPPIILRPMNNDYVKPLHPQFISFSWTPSGVAGKTRYHFRLVDLTATQLFNPNDAFEQGNVLPFFEQRNLITNTFQLDLSKPKLAPGHTYALQVVAYDISNTINYKNKGRSQVTIFHHDDPVIQGELSKGRSCVAASRWIGKLSDKNKPGIANGAEIKVGNFTIKNTVFTKSNGTYSGSGEIEVDFLNTVVKVEFDDVMIGEDNRLIKGIVKAKHELDAINNIMYNHTKELITTLPDTTLLLMLLEEEKRKVFKTQPGSLSEPLSLPISLNRNDKNVGIVGMNFLPREAYIDAVLYTSFQADTASYPLLFSEKNIPIHPGGFGSGASLKMPLVGNNESMFSSKKCFVIYNCEGANNIVINGKIMKEQTTAGRN